VNAEAKEKSKQWMHTYSLNKPKKLKQSLSACQKADGNSFLGQNRKGMLMMEFMQRGTTVTSEIYCERIKCLGPAIQTKGMEYWLPV
jgi:hypothetical protein